MEGRVRKEIPMKAAVLNGIEDLEIKEIPRPTPFVC